MYIYTIKDNDESATGDFWKLMQRKFLKNTLNLGYKPINEIIIHTPISLQ